MKLHAFRFTNHDLRSEKNYNCSYRFGTLKNTAYQIDYRSKLNFTEECQLSSSSGETITLKPKKGLGSFSVELINDDVSLGRYANRKLYDANDQIILRVVDPSSLPTAVLRSMMQGDPPSLLFLNSDDSLCLASMTRKKRKTNIPWPLSIIANLATLASSKQDPSFTLDIQSEEVDTLALLAIAVILDAHRDSLQAPL